jgi:hypothetical protein
VAAVQDAIDGEDKADDGWLAKNFVVKKVRHPERTPTKQRSMPNIPHSRRNNNRQSDGDRNNQGLLHEEVPSNLWIAYRS